MMSRDFGDRFEVGARLGSGSFGVVYEAFDRYRNRSVALKVLERVAADTVARFKREFRYLAEVRHPNLASMYELLVVSHQWILVMERIQGQELLEHLAALELQQSFLSRIPTEVDLDDEATLMLAAGPGVRDALSSIYIEQVREAFRQLAVAISVLHGHGIVHRDIKPSNIMITPEGRVVLLDFGLVLPHSYDDSLDRRAIVGTPGFMSPEQVKASAITAATDWYSFGALLFQALTGRMPFSGPTPLAILEKQMHHDPPRADQSLQGVPEDLATLAFDCLQREPGRRPGDDQILERVGMPRFDHRWLERSGDRHQVLVGRVRELRTLRRYIDSVQPGVPRVVMLHGSPGAGKSALAGHLLDELRSAGQTLILGGRCQPWESVPLNAIDVVVDSLTRELRRQHSEAIEQIMRKAIAVTQLFPVLSAAAPSDAGDERVSLPAFGARLLARASAELRSILRETAAGRPVVIVLDDAQFGDYQSSEMFRRLLEKGGQQRLVLILCYRTEDWRTSLLLQGLEAPGFERREMHLKELSRTTTGKLVRALTGLGGRRLVDQVVRQGCGNPMLTRMIAEIMSSELDDALLGRAVNLRLERCSAAAQRLFAFLLTAEEAVFDFDAEHALELFEIDEPLRALASERLIRLRRTGDLREIDIYHPRMRAILRAPVLTRPSAVRGIRRGGRPSIP